MNGRRVIVMAAAALATAALALGLWTLLEGRRISPARRCLEKARWIWC